MNQLKVFPFYFPTTALFLDDDRDFLFNFSLQLDEQMSYHLFDSPQKAQKHIHEQALRNERKAYFELIETGAPPSQTHVLTLSLANIHREIYNRRRFSEVSVLVVDYMMPEVDGLTFCQRLGDAPIKKILLTGKAGEDTAIKAFNDGIIDRYIQKNDPHVGINLNRAVKELQIAYFADNARTLVHGLHVDALDFLFDEAFADYFSKLCKELNIIEYYLCEFPKGFILMDQNANKHFLMIQTTQDLTIHYEIALDEGAPSDALKLLQTGQKIPYFKDSEGIYNKALDSWDKYFYEAKEIIGNTHYYCALQEGLPFATEDKTILPYATYLDKLDYILTEKMPS